MEVAAYIVAILTGVFTGGYWIWKKIHERKEKIENPRFRYSVNKSTPIAVSTICVNPRKDNIHVESIFAWIRIEVLNNSNSSILISGVTHGYLTAQTRVTFEEAFAKLEVKQNMIHASERIDFPWTVASKTGFKVWIPIRIFIEEELGKSMAKLTWNKAYEQHEEFAKKKMEQVERDLKKKLISLNQMSKRDLGIEIGKHDVSGLSVRRYQTIEKNNGNWICSGDLGLVSPSLNLDLVELENSIEKVSSLSAMNPSNFSFEFLLSDGGKRKMAIPTGKNQLWFAKLFDLTGQSGWVDFKRLP